MSELKAGDRVYISAVHSVTGEERRRFGTVEKFIDMFGMVDIRFDDSEFITPVEFALVFKEGEEPKRLINDYTKLQPGGQFSVCPRCNRVGKIEDDRFLHVVEGIFTQKDVDYCERCIVCNGQGFTEEDYEDEHGFIQRIQPTCQACEGIGWV